MGRLSKARWCLLGCLIVVVMLTVGSVFMPSMLTNAVTWIANQDSAVELRQSPKQETARENALVEIVAETIAVSKIDYQPVVLLKEKGGELYLPIRIGPLEATAIAVILEGVEVRRPLTPDLLCHIIDRTGASVDYIVINDLQNATFYAKIILNANWERMEIDARPSDAIAVALRVGAPIYVKKAILDKKGVGADHEPDNFTIRQWEIVV